MSTTSLMLDPLQNSLAVTQGNMRTSLAALPYTRAESRNDRVCVKNGIGCSRGRSDDHDSHYSGSTHEVQAWVGGGHHERYARSKPSFRRLRGSLRCVLRPFQ